MEGSIFGAGSSSSKNIFGKSSESGIFGQSTPSLFKSTSNWGGNNPSSEAKGFLFGKKVEVGPERVASEEEIDAVASVVCSNVPENLLKKNILEPHFRKFGSLKKISIRGKLVVIHYGDHESAKRAKENGAWVSSNAPPIGQIFYSNKSLMNKRDPPKESLNTEEVAEEEGDEEYVEEDEEEEENDDYFESPESEEQDAETKIEENIFKVKKPIFTSKQFSLSSHGNTFQERHEVLSARDNQIRKSFSVSDVEGARLKGTCPDMCPESELYRRSIQNRLRVYEKKKNGSLNEKAIVKEYSRSSADQDVPLCHELRPGRVLVLTMDHLLCNIIDRIEGYRGSVWEWFEYLEKNGSSEGFVDHSGYRDNVGEWFEFVWSATRAIRKDITQQRMTDITAVDLVEKCARFHIICAERLVEADSRDFSKKLNDENLTKCLQSLQHLYYDLRLEGVKCINEPEFRAYEILMNANDGDILRRVSTLDPIIRRSMPVQFVLRIFNALNNNNYVKFFKLIKEATLLQGCILLRYFNQVRSKAIETIVKAYCPPKSLIKFDLLALTEMLGFEDESDAEQYFRAHGLYVENGLVHLERNAFIFPDEIPMIKRPIQRIENKRTTDWSIVINGGSPLPSNPYLVYTPSSSFEDNGRLKDDFSGNVDSNKLKREEEERRVQLEAEFIKRQKVSMIEDASREVAEEIFEDFLVTNICDIGRDVVQYVDTLNFVSSQIVDIAIDEYIVEVLKDILREARNEEIQKRLLFEEKLNVSSDVLESYVSQFVSEFCQEIGGEEMQIVENKLHLQELFSGAEILVEEDINSYVDAQIQKIVSEVLNEAELEREARIEKMKTRMEVKLKEKFFNLWKKFYAKQSRKRYILQNFPSNPRLFSDIQTQNETLGAVAKPIKLSEALRKTEDTDYLFKYLDLEDDFLRSAVLEPVDFPSLIEPNIPPEAKTWKLLLCIPDLDSDSPGRQLIELVKRKLKYAPSSESKDILTCYSSKTKSVVIRSIDQDSLCREIVYNELKRKEYLYGTKGILFVYLEDERIEEAVLRLDTLLNNLQTSTAVPLLVLTDTRCELINSLKLVEALKKGIISCYEVKTIPGGIFDFRTPLAVLDGLKSLANKCPHDEKEYLSNTLRSFIEKILYNKFYKEIYFNRQKNSRLRRSPEVLIEFYNSVVDYMADVLKDSLNKKISWPVPELHPEVPVYWNDPSYLDLIFEALNFIKLPHVEHSIPLNWDEAVALVFDYFNSIKRSYGDPTTFLSEIRRSIYKNYVEGEVDRERLPWEDIIRCCADYKLSISQTLDRFDDENTNGGKELMVVYEEKMKKYNPPRSWMKEYLSYRESPENTTEVEYDSYQLNNCSKMINDELEASRVFENRLLEAVNEDGIHRVESQSTVAMSDDKLEDFDDKDFEEDGEEKENEDFYGLRSLYEREYVPVISYLSPSLGAAVSPINVTKRLEIVYSGKSPAFTRSRRREKRKSDFPDREPFSSKKMSADDMLTYLRSRVRDELEASQNFSDKLLDLTS